MIGRRAAKRRKSGGKRAIGRDSVSVDAWRQMRHELGVRCHGRCENPRCARLAADPHHVMKTSQGGPDALWNLVALCRGCHRQTDQSTWDGKLNVYHTIIRKKLIYKTQELSTKVVFEWWYRNGLVWTEVLTVIEDGSKSGRQNGRHPWAGGSSASGSLISSKDGAVEQDQ